MIRRKLLSETDDCEALDSISQIGDRMVDNGVQLNVYRKRSKKTVIIRTTRQAKNDYYQASDSYLQINHLLVSDGVHKENHTNSSKMWV